MIITGTVIKGEQVGRTIGFPSANFDTKLDVTSLPLGVYVCQGKIDEQMYYGLAYFGPRYVHGQLQNSFEVYFYDFSGDLYQRTLTVEILTYIREPIPFTSLEQVEQQLTKDKAAGLQFIQKNR